MLNLRAQHCLLTKIFTFNRDMFVGGTYTSYRYTSRENCALIQGFSQEFIESGCCDVTNQTLRAATRCVTRRFTRWWHAGNLRSEFAVF